MRKLGLALALCLGLAPAQAQVVTMPPPAGTQAILCVYNASPPTLSTGNVGFIQCDSSGKLITSGGGSGGAITFPVLSTTSSSALAANTVINSAASALYSFNVSADSTLSGAAWWIMIYNATSAPADGAVTPVKCYAMPLGTTSYSAAFPSPVPFSTGIVIGVSTTGCFTKTASTHAFISGDYK